MYKITLTHEKLYKNFYKWTWLCLEEMREATLTTAVGIGQFAPSL